VAQITFLFWSFLVQLIIQVLGAYIINCNRKTKFFLIKIKFCILCIYKRSVYLNNIYKYIILLFYVLWGKRKGGADHEAERRLLGAEGGPVKTSRALYIYYVFFFFEKNLFLIMRDAKVVYAGGSGIYIYIYSGVGDNCVPVNVKNCFGFVIGRWQ